MDLCIKGFLYTFLIPFWLHQWRAFEFNFTSVAETFLETVSVLTARHTFYIKSDQTIIGIEIISLTFSKICFAGRWIFGNFLCNLWLFLNFLMCSASIFNLCVVSGDRYIAVTSPLNYMSRMNERRVKQIIGISWGGALILASFLIYGTNASKTNSKNCSIWGLHYEYSIVLLVAGYVLPVSLLVFANGKVLFIARTHLNKIHAQEFSLSALSEVPVASCGSEQGPTTRGKQMPSKRRIRREIRIFKTFLIVTCAFLLSWTPFVVILFIDSMLNVPVLIRHSSIILLYCNSALNPFIYGFYNSEFRKALSESLGCK